MQIGNWSCILFASRDFLKALIYASASAQLGLVSELQPLNKTQKTDNDTDRTTDTSVNQSTSFASRSYSANPQ